MFPLIWSNSHLNSDNPYSRRRRPSEHARRWKQKSRLSKQYINVTGFRPLLFHWEAMNSKHGKRHSRHESWDVRKKQTEKSLTWPLPHKLWPNYSEAIKSSTIYWEPAILKLVSLISESNIIKVWKKTTKSVSLGLGSAKNQTSENAKTGKRKCVVMERRKYFANDDTMFCFVQFSCFWMTDAGAKLLSFDFNQNKFYQAWSATI